MSKAGPVSKRISVGLCHMETHSPDGEYMYRCIKRKDHVPKQSKFMKTHMDSKRMPAKYWEPTQAEIDQVRKELEG